MRQYEIRTKDLKAVLVKPFGCFNDVEANARYLKFLPSEPDGVLVMHEFESQSEADKARLDWLDAKMDVDDEIKYDIGCMRWTSKEYGSFTRIRELLDVARKAQKPTITVIATPEGVK